MDVTVPVPDERIEEPALHDKKLTARHVAERDIAALGLDGANWKWVHIMQQRLGTRELRRVEEILAEVLELTREQAPLPEQRPYYLVSVFEDDGETRLGDVLITGATCAALALAAGMTTIMQRTSLTVNRRRYGGQVFKIDRIADAEFVAALRQAQLKAAEHKRRSSFFDRWRNN